MPENFNFIFDFSKEYLQEGHNIRTIQKQEDKSWIFFFRNPIAEPYFVQVITDASYAYRIEKSEVSFSIFFVQKSVEEVMFIIHK